MTMQIDSLLDDLELSSEESAILNRILKGELNGNLDNDMIYPRAIFSPIPQSFSQQRLWILDRLVPGNAFYNLPSAIRLKGPLDAGILEQSLTEVIRRHESLRTVFSMENEEPVQVILPEQKLTIIPIDLGALSRDEQESTVLRRLKEEAQTPFDLQQGPLFRVILLQLSMQEHVLLYNMHHIISDAWSMGLFIKELSIFYAAFSRGEVSLLPKPALQYGDYAVWQRQRLKGETLEKQLSYWRQLLGGELPILELPTDRQRPAVSSYQGGLRSFKIPELLTAKLLELSHKENCSLFMILLAAFNVLLYRYSGQEDILVGSPIANRNRAELEGIIGFFANTLVYRTDLSGNPTFRQLLARVHDMTTHAYDNQDIPFEKLVEELQPQRFMSHNPLFQVMFVMQNVPRQTADTGGLEIHNVAIHSGTSKFDLWLSATQSETLLTLTFEYSYDIFVDSTITRLFGHFQELLQAVIQDPDDSILLLEIIPGEEKKQLLIDFNSTDADFPRGKTLHELFTEQASKTPDYIAVFCHGRTRTDTDNITYRQLNEQADRLAGLLIEKGSLLGDIIGIMMERSVEMVIGILAILKSGGAYLPIDPELPQERIDYMLKDSNAKILLGMEECQKKIIVNCQLLIVNCKLKSMPQALLHHSSFIIHHSNLAYIIYTSGTTGRPKGVIIPHEGIVNRLHWMQRQYGLTGEDRVLQKTPFGFDVSVWEFFWTLLNGARLVMALPGGHKDSAYLVDSIIREGITTLHFVPAMLNVFLEEPGARAICSLKRVICSGEALPLEYQQRFFKIFGPGVELHNLYGPTEASVDVTYWECERETQLHHVPIGRPVANTQIYILDRCKALAPIGVYGEICIGGIQLARGYLNNPELTRGSFSNTSKKCAKKTRIWDTAFKEGNSQGRAKRVGAPPHFEKPPLDPAKLLITYHLLHTTHHSPLYHTGDLARWLPDGNIEFLGRIDQQVKVRGYRIELGEIESKLRGHAFVEEAAVLTVEDAQGSTDKKLAAYIVLKSDYWKLYKEKSGVDIAGEQVSDWQGVFDDAYLGSYKEAAVLRDPAFNIAGWNSSYTAEPIPSEEMRLWVESTVERILLLKPGRVMEIGCGTGLYLFRIIPFCRYYLGADIAQQGLTYIKDQLDIMKSGGLNPAGLAEVELKRRSAENFDGIEKESLDMVILNSVVQYFPTVEYLVEVLTKAAEAVRPGGHIFLGDVRSLPLLKVFCASVEFYKAKTDDPGISREKLNQRIMNRIARENELVVDPAFFTALKWRLPRLKHVNIQLKRGKYSNELINFRYDVVLHIGNESPGRDDREPVVEPLILDWRKDCGSLPFVRRLLAEQKPGCVEISGVPNKRIADDIRVLKWLTSRDDMNTLSRFLETPMEKQDMGIDPEDFWRLQEEFPYHVFINPPAAEKIVNAEGTYDVMLWSSDLGPFPGIDVKDTSSPRLWNSYANNPLLGKVTAQLAPELRSYLKEKLPEYMVPSYFIPLETLPLTSSGKLDRKSLPVIDSVRKAFSLEQERNDAKPRTNTEKLFTETWKEVLLTDSIGLNDNFFQLGGDSINVIQVISRINKRGFNLTVRDLYMNMTIEELARYADKQQTDQALSGEAVVAGRVIKIDRKEILNRIPLGTEIEDIYPMTPFQKHMLWWYLQAPRGSGEPGLFVNQVISKIPAKGLDISLLKKTMQDMTDAYPYLRTAFMWEGLPEPVQVVYKKVVAHFEYHDWSHLAPAEREQQVNNFIIFDHDRGFERDNPLVYRVSLLRTDEDECLLLRTSDLMRVDGWSAQGLQLKFNEYSYALFTGQAVELKSENIYKEYLNWVTAQGDFNGEEFWKNMIADCEAPTPLVAHAPHNAPGQGKGFTFRRSYFGRELTAQMDMFLKERRVVLSALGCAVWAILLSKITSRKSVVFGLLFSGRGSALPGIETMIGQAMNILPVRLDIPGEKPVSEWLKNIWELLIEVNGYECNQQDKIRELWGIQQGTPLFESYFVIENFPGIKENLSKALSLGKGGPGFDYTAQMEYPLRVELQPSIDLGLIMQYYRRSFTPISIETMMNAFQALLTEIIKNPNRDVGDFEVLL